MFWDLCMSKFPHDHAINDTLMQARISRTRNIFWSIFILSHYGAMLIFCVMAILLLQCSSMILRSTTPHTLTVCTCYRISGATWTVIWPEPSSWPTWPKVEERGSSSGSRGGSHTTLLAAKAMASTATRASWSSSSCLCFAVGMVKTFFSLTL